MSEENQMAENESQQDNAQQVEQVPAELNLNRNQVIVAWSYLYPFAKLREASGHTLINPDLLEQQARIFSDENRIDSWLAVVNREATAESFQLNAPEHDGWKLAARSVAGNMPYIESLLRDTLAAIHSAQHVNGAVDCNVLGFHQSRDAITGPEYLTEENMSNPNNEVPQVQSNAMHDNPPLYPPTEEQLKGPATEQQPVDPVTGEPAAINNATGDVADPGQISVSALPEPNPPVTGQSEQPAS